MEMLVILILTILTVRESINQDKTPIIEYKILSGIRTVKKQKINK